MNTPLADIIFLGHCPDKVGLVAAITRFFAQENVNILNLEQHSERGHFFIRIEGKEEADPQSIPTWLGKFRPVGQKLAMEFNFYDPLDRLRVALFCSKTLPCPMEIIARQLSGDLNIDLQGVISNHCTIEPMVNQLNIPFYHIPTTGEIPDFEGAQLAILQKMRPDLVVLARYMKILSQGFLQALSQPIINIHHSFLPSFIGNDPYEQAYRRGVKLIGATAHFVTKELDEGPIICQDITQVSHRFSIAQMKQLGGDIEKQVLACALRKFTERKVVQWQGRTIVFH